MTGLARLGRRLDDLVARVFDRPIPESEQLPRSVAPLPTWLENIGLRLAWLVVAVNLAGTAFGFWYYRFQFEATQTVMWPFVPDSPVATLFIGLSLAAWRLDLEAEWLHMLAFFGCIKLGFWTPYVQLFLQSSAGIADWLYYFLIVSHLAMAIEAFLIHRYARFSVPAVAVATGWHLANDVVDYFWPIVGEYHHTVLRAEYVGGAIDHGVPAHGYAAAAAVVLTVTAVFLALATRVAKGKRDTASPS
jgi:uncharacterized membrane protein YpjA